jgi:hypothetical protein
VQNNPVENELEEPTRDFQLTQGGNQGNNRLVGYAQQPSLVLNSNTSVGIQNHMGSMSNMARMSHQRHQRYSTFVSPSGDNSPSARMPPLPPVNRPTGGNYGDEYSVNSSLGSQPNLNYIQLDAYNVDPLMLHDLHDTQKDAISRIVRGQIFSKVKFLPKSGKAHEKVLGSFWKPDLVADTPKYIDAILDNFPDLKLRKNDETHLVNAVHFWMKASTMVRQVVLDRRSNVTQRLKRELVIGK